MVIFPIMLMMQIWAIMWDKKFIYALMVFLLAACFQANAKVYLVSVGIADYPGTSSDLSLPVKDAKTITWLYSKNSNVEYKQLLDSRATKSNIIDAMTTLFAKAGRDDIVVLFFSEGRPQHSQSSVNSAKKAQVMLFLSSRSDEVSREIPSMQNGFFTTYLQKGLRGNADANRDRTITAKELFDFVSEGVIKISNGKQHPVMWGKFPDNMPVMVW